MGFEIKNSEKDGRFMRLNWSKPSKRAYEECGRIAIFIDRESREFVDDEQAKEDSAMESYKLNSLSRSQISIESISLGKAWEATLFTIASLSLSLSCLVFVILPQIVDQITYVVELGIS
ncbi:hypothetical protein PanWU01x14_208210 [Parasponia andersonii]|uniref:Uncharacterized protein n=1 Tax=Parasponia andersonii TaxID=3476 RepID=A0A2P5BUW2_PARAD|nr:hypothetical protein PanWU01x14_208210 [Parasponia andersonii]